MADVEETITKFIAAAIVQAQLKVVERYRLNRSGYVKVAMTTKDDDFMDLTDRAVCSLGFNTNDFPPCEALDLTFTMAPCDALPLIGR